MYSNKKPDVYTLVNSGYHFIIMMSACNSVFSDAIDSLSYPGASKQDYALSLIIILSLYSSIGASIFNYRANVANQEDVAVTTRVNSETSLESVTDYNSMDLERGSAYTDRNFLTARSGLSYYDIYILSCVCCSSFCFCIFPSLFICYNFDVESKAKGLKSGLICVSSLFGVAYSVASARNAKNFLLGK